MTGTGITAKVNLTRIYFSNEKMVIKSGMANSPNISRESKTSYNNKMIRKAES